MHILRRKADSVSTSISSPSPPPSPHPSSPPSVQDDSQQGSATLNKLHELAIQVRLVTPSFGLRSSG
eukprot:638360-Pyramimonas_sp.AAC.2